MEIIEMAAVEEDPPTNFYNTHEIYIAQYDLPCSVVNIYEVSEKALASGTHTDLTMNPVKKESWAKIKHFSSIKDQKGDGLTILKGMPVYIDKSIVLEDKQKERGTIELCFIVNTPKSTGFFSSSKDTYYMIVCTFKIESRYPPLNTILMPETPPETPPGMERFEVSYNPMFYNEKGNPKPPKLSMGGKRKTMKRRRAHKKSRKSLRRRYL